MVRGAGASGVRHPSTLAPLNHRGSGPLERVTAAMAMHGIHTYGIRLYEWVQKRIQKRGQRSLLPGGRPQGFTQFLGQVRQDLRDEQGLGRAIALTATAIAAVLAMREGGLLDGFELTLQDQLVQLRGDRGPSPDERLLVIGITDEDIQTQQRWPISDRTLAEAITQLQRHRPAAIGLDLYRDVRHEPGFNDLAIAIRAPNIITIRKIAGVPAYLAYGDHPPVDRIGLNDIPLDSDGVVRRTLLMADTPSGEFFFSLPLRLAVQYFAQRPGGPTPEADPDNPYWMRFGPSTFRPLDRSSGLYRNLDSGGQQILLDYRTWDDQVARTYSLTALLAGKIPPEHIRDRIVLVGTVAESARDLFETPYSSGKQEAFRTPGVFVHAQAVSQILDVVEGKRPLPWYWSDAIEILWIVALASGTGFLVWAIKTPRYLALVTGGVALAIGGVAYGAALGGGSVPLVTPTLAATLAGGILVAHRGYQASQQKKMIMTLLGQSTSPAIAAALWERREELVTSGRLAGRKATVTLLFSDIRNFSTISEQLSPEELFEWLNEYLGMLSDRVGEHGGIVNKFMGDGMMAVFGVPVPRTDPDAIAQDAQNAVRCALAIATGLDHLNQAWQRQNKRMIQMRIGIFTGEVIIGSLGGKDRLEYGIIGDSVNTASRLESCRKEHQMGDCRIIIGEPTYRAIEGQVVAHPWGELGLKGKNNRVMAYRVEVPTAGAASAASFQGDGELEPPPPAIAPPDGAEPLPPYQNHPS